MNTGAGLWTEVKIEQLCELWAEGLTAREIAEQLGRDFTRGGVIGKAWRLKLKPRPSPLCPPKPKRIPVPQPLPPPPPPEDFSKGPPRLLSADQRPCMRRLQLVELEPHHCKFPIGDPHTSNFYFCAADTTGGKIYCEFHFRRAFASTAKERVR